jgi:hypothetical protein
VTLSKLIRLLFLLLHYPLKVKQKWFSLFGVIFNQKAPQKCKEKRGPSKKASLVLTPIF